ncbi:MAG: hypothetical protein J5965_19860 [Aeriscardovia sp.]|nr:hypothetical protein [Aeriscardovia sp.]
MEIEERELKQQRIYAQEVRIAQLEEVIEKMKMAGEAVKSRLTGLRDEARELDAQNVEKRSEAIFGANLRDFSWAKMKDAKKKF